MNCMWIFSCEIQEQFLKFTCNFLHMKCMWKCEIQLKIFCNIHMRTSQCSLRHHTQYSTLTTELCLLSFLSCTCTPFLTQSGSFSVHPFTSQGNPSVVLFILFQRLRLGSCSCVHPLPRCSPPAGRGRTLSRRWLRERRIWRGPRSSTTSSQTSTMNDRHRPLHHHQSWWNNCAYFRGMKCVEEQVFCTKAIDGWLVWIRSGTNLLQLSAV